MSVSERRKRPEAAEHAKKRGRASAHFLRGIDLVDDEEYSPTRCSQSRFDSLESWYVRNESSSCHSTGNESLELHVNKCSTGTLDVSKGHVHWNDRRQCCLNDASESLKNNRFPATALANKQAARRTRRPDECTHVQQLRELGHALNDAGARSAA